ncbi:MAG: spore cortex-lytic enzyme [Eubacteriales bacterium]|nr:spore cortex-lytic enzyme [Eubacteriales bacterium]
MNKRTFSLIAVIALVVTITSSFYETNSALSKYGNVSEEVRAIQERLKYLGYDIGNVDGVYGSKTQKAVYRYQRANGLKADGIAGKQTLSMLGIKSNTTSTANNNDINMLAQIINAEARGEAFEGQVAVGAVVLNRVSHTSFPGTIAGVIFQPGAFTAISDGQWHAGMTDNAFRAATLAYNGWDPTGGAIYYYNPAKTTSKWIYSRPVVAKIGKHTFAK